MRLTNRIVLLPLVLAIAAPLRAQQSRGVDTLADSTRAAARAILLAAPAVSDSSARVVATPTTDRRAAVHYAPSRQPTELTLQRQRAGLGQPMAMMIVGGAAFLAGAIVGDTPGTIMMIGGAVIGLVGLYEYLQ